jgi:hypothetical protein
MISRLLIHLTFPLVTAFTAAVLLIRAQPYHDNNLRTLLIPERCLAPCFMGIRPGITTVDDAISILEKHEWVAGIEPHFIPPENPSEHYRGWVYWDWKADAPIWFRAAPDVMRGHAGVFDSVDGLVVDITVATNVPFGSIRLTMGRPSGYGLSFTNVIITKGVFTSASLQYRGAYLEDNIQVETVSLCSDTARLWFKPSSITFFDDQQMPELAIHLLAYRPFLSELDVLKRSVCLGRS